MVLIQVKRKDVDTVFGILLHNGKFTGLKGNKFIIYENADEALAKIEDAEIEIEKL